MSHDRSDSSNFPIAHEFLSLMLGERRVGVTAAVGSLQAQGFIAAGRGQITIIGRPGLEKRAGDNYGIPEENYRDLVER